MRHAGQFALVGEVRVENAVVVADLCLRQAPEKAGCQENGDLDSIHYFSPRN